MPERPPNVGKLKQFATALGTRLKSIQGEEQQQWYISLACAALDQTEQDIDKAMDVADKAFAVEDKAELAVAKMLSNGVIKLSRLRTK